ncbi:hypothetical protein BGX23_003265 [Mortierella sp. AD031]|nr:hypothetical protein BGX23_003265 [Mortierella sp. AD031]
MELFEKGDLLSVLKKNYIKHHTPLPEKVAMWMAQAVDAIIYLHEEKGTVHRDLKDAWGTKAYRAPEINGN